VQTLPKRYPYSKSISLDALAGIKSLSSKDQVSILLRLSSSSYTLSLFSIEFWYGIIHIEVCAQVPEGTNTWLREYTPTLSSISRS